MKLGRLLFGGLTLIFVLVLGGVETIHVQLTRHSLQLQLDAVRIWQRQRAGRAPSDGGGDGGGVGFMTSLQSGTSAGGGMMRTLPGAPNGAPFHPNCTSCNPVPTAAGSRRLTCVNPSRSRGPM